MTSARRGRASRGGCAVAVASSAIVLAPGVALAQEEQQACALICGVELKLEPTFTFENIAGRPRLDVGGAVERVDMGTAWELVFAADLATLIPRVGLTLEAIVSGGEVELEGELNFSVLSEDQTGGWLSSHVDVIDQYSPAERPGEEGFNHKLDLEWDTALHLFSGFDEGNWLRNVELEVSLDYLASGLPRAGDAFATETYLDDASPWSLSVVLVAPFAPLAP